MGNIFGINSKTPTTIGGMDLGPIVGNIIGNSSSSGGSSSSRKRSDADVLGGMINDMYHRFEPEEITYEAKSEEEIRSSIAEWLRPGYDKSITNRQEQTQTNKANLDADAIARGMGASTYVTDVKNRQQNAEARDVATLESNYGATLAERVVDGVETEKQRTLEVEQFNADQRQRAYEMAYSAALVLFQAYKKR